MLCPAHWSSWGYSYWKGTTQSVCISQPIICSRRVEVHVEKRQAEIPQEEVAGLVMPGPESRWGECSAGLCSSLESLRKYGIHYDRIVQYKSTVRKFLDVDNTALPLFILSGAQPLTNLSSWIQALGRSYGLVLPTATRVRKIGATSVALNLGDTAKARP